MESLSGAEYSKLTSVCSLFTRSFFGFLYSAIFSFLFHIANHLSAALPPHFPQMKGKKNDISIVGFILLFPVVSHFSLLSYVKDIFRLGQ